ncbi:MAG TPA: hypothetical protein DIS76_04670 [Rhodospirillaceae bacterium]|nr:hypothetical protein [Rhodospirillaceae bacterium]
MTKWRLLVIVLLTAIAGPGYACGLFSDRPVRLTGEEAAIIYNGPQQPQHFIRTAKFSANNVGFIVPVPARPEVTESDADLLLALKKLSIPPQRSGLSKGELLGSSLEIIDEKQVAGFTATTLKASDASALVGWLKDKGFAIKAAEEKWINDYTADAGTDWHFIAFHFQNKKRDMVEMESKAIRISFTYPVPFYPYKEPQPENPSLMAACTMPPRNMKLFLLAPQQNDYKPVFDRKVEDSYFTEAELCEGRPTSRSTPIAGTGMISQPRIVLNSAQLERAVGARGLPNEANILSASQSKAFALYVYQDTQRLRKPANIHFVPE